MTERDMTNIYDVLPWVLVEDRNDTHVVPQGDTYKHLYRNCWCKPVNHGDVIAHNSADQREYYAEYGRKLN